MPNMQYALNPLNYPTVVSGVTYTAAPHPGATSGSFDSNYPASNILDLSRPRRYSKTTTSGTTRWGIDLGTTFNLAAITLENTNMNDCFIKGGTNSVGDPSLVTNNFGNGTGANFATDAEDGRKKHLCVLSGFTGVRYLQIGPQTNPGDGYYQLGAVGIWVTLNTLSKNFSLPYEKTILDDAEVLEYQQGGREVSIPQPTYIQFALQARLPRTDTSGLAQYRALANYRRDRVVMLYENQSDLSKVYHVRRSASFRMTRTENATVTVSGIQLLEVV